MQRKSTKRASRISGTKEWADREYNCYIGCEHNCRYCYARAGMVRRKQVESAAAWARPKVRPKQVARRMGKIAKRAFMFPTTHDITPRNLKTCMIVLQHLLDGGNRVLIVSKPHLDCIKTICKTFADRRDMILFRFTIGGL